VEKYEGWENCHEKKKIMIFLPLSHMPELQQQ